MSRLSMHGRESKVTSSDVARIHSCFRALLEARRAWKELLSQYRHLSPSYLYQLGKGRDVPLSVQSEMETETEV
jgi:hypothetical protein